MDSVNLHVTFVQRFTVYGAANPSSLTLLACPKNDGFSAGPKCFPQINTLKRSRVNHWPVPRTGMLSIVTNANLILFFLVAVPSVAVLLSLLPLLPGAKRLFANSACPLQPIHLSTVYCLPCACKVQCD
jgi:hypothetical protein